LKNNHKRIVSVVSVLFFFVGSIVPLQADRVDLKRCSLESFDLLIIAPSAFSEEIQPLVDHKNSIGMDTALMTLEHIRSLPETSVGRDDAEKMKYYIKYAIETYDISYVLLVGGKIGQRDTWYLPVRYVQMDNGWEPKYITDLYFADIYDMHGGFSSWDSDNDGIFGEWIEASTPMDTGIDLYPDISIGRLPCRSELEVTIVMTKIITYETTTYLQNWFNNMVAIAGDT